MCICYDNLSYQTQPRLHTDNYDNKLANNKFYSTGLEKNKIHYFNSFNNIVIFCCHGKLHVNEAELS